MDIFRNGPTSVNGRAPADEAPGRLAETPTACRCRPDDATHQTRHSIDFASVLWFSAYYAFTGNQAAAVRVLWEAWENGTPELRQETILEASGSVMNRLCHVFMHHPAWGTMIVRGSHKGLFRLAEPSTHDCQEEV